MNYFWRVLLLFFLIIAAGCSGKADVPETDYPVINNPEWGSMQDYETPPFKFELVDSILIKTPNDEIIGSIGSLLTDDSGNIYFMDRQQSKLVSISSNGNLRWMTGQKGKGPGDFEQAYSMITDRDQLLISNIGGTRIDKFSFDGNFISSLNLSKNLSSVSLHDVTFDNLLAVTIPSWGTYGFKTLFLKAGDESIEIIDSLVVDESDKLKMHPGFSMGTRLTFQDSLIINGSLVDYSLTFYNRKGEILKVINREFNKNMKPGFYQSENSTTIRGFGGVNSPYFMPNNIMMVLTSWPDNISDSDEYMRKSAAGNAPQVEFKNFIDFFNLDGKLLYTIEGEGYFPKIGAIQHIDNNGIIYTATAEPKPVIYRYKLIGPEQL